MLLEDGETYCSLNNRRLYVLKWAREKGLLSRNRIGVRVKQHGTGTSKVATKYSLERCSNSAKFMAGPRAQDTSQGDGEGAAGDAAAASGDDRGIDEEEGAEEEKVHPKTKHRGKQRKDHGNHSDYLWGSAATTDEPSLKGPRSGGNRKATAGGGEDGDDDGEDEDGDDGDDGTGETLDHKRPAVRSGADGVRNKYAAHGSSTAYYAEEGGTYTNPHDGAIKAILSRLVVAVPGMWAGKVLDLACGSGEATEALVEAGLQYSSIDACDPYTLDAYYARCRPFFPSVNIGGTASSTSGAGKGEGAADVFPATCSSMDAVEASANSGAAAAEHGAAAALAAANALHGVCVGVSVDVGVSGGVGIGVGCPGDGLVTEGSAEGTDEVGDGVVGVNVVDKGISIPDATIDAATKELLSEQVFAWSFEDVAAGILADRPHYSVVVCSFALHLCEPSYLATTCSALAVAADHLIVLTPHKRPDIKPAWGWTVVSDERDDHWRVRYRHYRSNFSSE